MNPNLKILYHHRVASKDGQYVHVAEIVNALRDLGHSVTVVEPKSTQRKEFGTGSGLVKNIRRYLPGFIHEFAEFCYGLIDYLQLAKEIRRKKPDIIYERYNLFFISGILAKKYFRIPLILEVNAPLYEERSNNEGISLGWLAKWSEDFAWKNADHCLPVTAVLAERIAIRGVKHGHITVIPNGVNQKEFPAGIDPKAIVERYALKEKLVLGFTGFVREWHRLDLVLDQIAKHHSEAWHLLIVGDGPDRKRLEHIASSLKIDHKITFTGIVPREEMPLYVASFDIALQPDVVDYASPLKLFEYLALGKAVLAPDRPNIREVLCHQQNALLFAPEDSDDFTRKLLELCNSRLIRDKLGSNAQQLVADRGLYWRKNAERIIATAKHYL